ncbi:hypothetical protein GCM10027084_12630 [Pseudoxanthomonas sangjuensis]
MLGKDEGVGRVVVPVQVAELQFGLDHGRLERHVRDALGENGGGILGACRKPGQKTRAGFRRCRRGKTGGAPGPEA